MNLGSPGLREGQVLHPDALQHHLQLRHGPAVLRPRTQRHQDQHQSQGKHRQPAGRHLQRQGDEPQVHDPGLEAPDAQVTIFVS